MLPLVLAGVTVLGLTGAAVYRVKIQKKGVLTPERKEVLIDALENIKSPEALKELASKFREEGLHVQAKLLELRAKIRGVPEEVKEARRTVFRNTMKLKDKKKVLHIAEVFESQGCTGAAGALRNYAETLTDVNQS